MSEREELLDALTAKQRAFVEYLWVHGGEFGSKGAAYRLAYGAKGVKPASVNNTANKLARHPKVAPLLLLGAEDRLERSIEITDKLADEYDISEMALKTRLGEIMDLGMKPTGMATIEEDGQKKKIPVYQNLQRAVAAIAEICKMDGHYAAGKLEVTNPLDPANLPPELAAELNAATVTH